MPYHTHLTLKECYAILSVSSEISLDELKRAYHRKALELHPDHNPDDPDATKNFQRLNEAYTELSNYLKGDKTSVTKGDEEDAPDPDDWKAQWEAYRNQWNFSNFSFFGDDEDDEESDREYEEADRDAYVVDDVDDSQGTDEESLNDLLSNPDAQRTFIYYTSKVKKLYPNESGEILYQLRFDSIYMAKISGNRLLGHALLEIMIRKLVKAGKAPSVLWLNTMLFIAKDPRESTKSESYRTWWRLMKPGYTNNVKRWLSDYDIDVFIKIMEALQDKMRIDDPEQALITRKSLLRGLYDHKYIREVRLFVGTPIIRYIREFYPESLPPFYTEMKGAGSFAAIYMNLRDKVHVVEGTHGTSIRILSKIPKKSVLAPDYDRKKSVTKADLGRKLIVAYHDEFNDYLCYEKQHSYNWKRDLVEIFDLLGMSIKLHFIKSSDEWYY